MLRFVASLPLLRLPFEILPLLRSQSLSPIILVIKLRIQMAGLETEHRPVGRHINREPPVALPKIFAIGGRRRNCRLANSRDSLRDLLMPRPRAPSSFSAKNPFGPELDVGHGPQRLSH